MDDSKKPSLARALLSEAEQAYKTTRMFGVAQLVDSREFSERVHEERRQCLKTRLIAGLHENALTAVDDSSRIADLQLRIESAQSFEELERLAFEAQDGVCERQARVAAIDDARFVRVDDVSAEGSLDLQWSAEGIGFGQLRIYVDKNGALRADTENMSRHFLRSILLRLADEMAIE